MIERRLQTTMRRFAAMAALACGCAHSSPPAGPLVAVSAEDHGDPPTSATAVYRVCIGTDGKVQSVEAIRTVPGYEKRLEEHFRAMSFRPQPVATCTAVRAVLEGVDPVVAAPVRADAAPATDDAARKPRNVPPHLFDMLLVEKPMPSVPEGVRIKYGNKPLVFVAKICTAADGTISQLSIIEGIPGADAGIVDTIRRWRISPPAGDAGICTMLRFVFGAGPR